MTPTANHLASLVLRLNELWNERASTERIADQLGHCRVIAEHIVRGHGGAPGATDVERAEWIADKIVALGDYAKEAAAMLRRWPVGVALPENPRNKPVTEQPR